MWTLILGAAKAAWGLISSNILWALLVGALLFGGYSYLKAWRYESRALKAEAQVKEQKITIAYQEKQLEVARRVQEQLKNMEEIVNSGDNERILAEYERLRREAEGKH